METKEKTIIVQVLVNAPVEKVWKCWNEPAHITKWCHASADWHAPFAENDLRVGGKFVTTMAAKDGSASFDFNGIYSAVKTNQLIEYAIEGGRKVKVEFISSGNATKVIETFEPEDENPLEMQKAGWQAILDSFKKHTEGQK